MTDPLKGKKILVIDDHPYFGINIKYNLEKLGCIVDTAIDGYVGITTAKTFNPDLIICDYIMPNKDGVQTVKELKMLDEMKDVPIIMFTSEALNTVIAASLDAGAVDFMVKTAGVDVVISKVRKHLGARLKQEKKDE